MSNRKTVYTIMCILLLAGLFPVKLYAQADYQVTEMSAQGMVSSETLNVRSGPGTGYKVIGIVAVGETVSITGQCDNNWYRIDYNGQEGYVSGKYIELTEKGAETEGTETEGAGTEETKKEEKNEKTSLLDFEWIKPVVILIIMAVVAVSILLTLRSIRKSDEDEEELYEDEEEPEDDMEYEEEELEEAEAYEPVKRQKTQMSQPRKNKKRRQEQQKQTVVLKEEDFLVHIDPVYFEEENKIEQPESIQEDKEGVKPEDIKKAMEKLEKLQEEIERLKQNQGQ